MYIGLHVKYPLFLSDFNETWILQTDLKKTFVSDLMKIRLVGAELFNEEVRADRQIDRHGEASSRVPRLIHFAFFSHNVFTCFVWISEQTAIIFLFNIN